jgi:hypothetical protein
VERHPERALRSYKQLHRALEQRTRARPEQLARLETALRRFDDMWFKASDAQTVNEILRQLPKSATRGLQIRRSPGHKLSRASERRVASAEIQALSKRLYDRHDLARISDKIGQLEAAFSEVLDQNFFRRTEDLKRDLATQPDAALVERAQALIAEIDHLVTSRTIAGDVEAEGGSDVQVSTATRGLFGRGSQRTERAHMEWKRYRLFPEASRYKVRVKDRQSIADGRQEPDDRTPLEARLIAEKALHLARILQALRPRLREHTQEIATYLERSRIEFELPRPGARYTTEYGFVKAMGSEPIEVEVQLTRAAADVAKLTRLGVMSETVAAALRAEVDRPLEEMLR